MLPADCTKYMSQNYSSTYKTMTVLPEELQTADYSNVTDMNMMFLFCTNLTAIPQFNTSKVTNMNNMLYCCENLTDIPQLDTSNVTNMHQMFFDCKIITTIPQLDTSKATNMLGMFSSCSALPSVFPWAIDCSSISTVNRVKFIFMSSSVKEVTFKNVNASIKEDFTADNLGSQLTKINFV